MSVARGEAWLTYRGAAARIRRSERTIKRWAAEGLSGRTDSAGRRVFRESDLLDEKRRRMMSNPVHKHRMRRLRTEQPQSFQT